MPTQHFLEMSDTTTMGGGAAAPATPVPATTRPRSISAPGRMEDNNESVAAKYYELYLAQTSIPPEAKSMTYYYLKKLEEQGFSLIPVGSLSDLELKFHSEQMHMVIATSPDGKYSFLIDLGTEHGTKIKLTNGEVIKMDEFGIGSTNEDPYLYLGRSKHGTPESFSLGKTEKYKPIKQGLINDNIPDPQCLVKLNKAWKAANKQFEMQYSKSFKEQQPSPKNVISALKTLITLIGGSQGTLDQQQLQSLRSALAMVEEQKNQLFTGNNNKLVNTLRKQHQPGSNAGFFRNHAFVQRLINSAERVLDPSAAAGPH